MQIDFFELLTAKDEYSFLLLDYNENLMSPVILLENNIQKMINLLMDYRGLENKLKNELPHHLSRYKDGYIFKLNDDGVIVSNITDLSGKEQMIVAITDNKNDADKFVGDLIRGRLKQCEDKCHFTIYGMCLYRRY